MRLALCGIKDPVWDRPCEKPTGHVLWSTAEERLHENIEPGDHLRWGSLRDIREVEDNAQLERADRQEPIGFDIQDGR